MKMTVEILRKSMPTILKVGGLVVDRYCILPLEYERMLLFPSVCGRLLMTGECFACETKEEAEIHLKKWGNPNTFSWVVDTEKYYALTPNAIATDLDVAVCKAHGFSIFRDLIYAHKYAVLSRGKGREKEFFPAKISNGSIQIVDNEACMVPEEAVGKIYLHLRSDHQKPWFDLYDVSSLQNQPTCRDLRIP